MKGTGAGSFLFTNLRYRKSNARPVDRAARPARPVPERDRGGRARPLPRLDRLARRARRGAVPGRSSRSRSRCPPTSSTAWSTSTGTSSRSPAPVFLIAGALAVRRARAPRGRAGSPCSPPAGSWRTVAFSLFAVWLGNRWQAQADAALGSTTRRRSRSQQGADDQPAHRRPALHAAYAEPTSPRIDQAKHAPGWQSPYAAGELAALGLLEKATAVQPDDADAWFHLGFQDSTRSATSAVPAAALRRVQPLQRARPVSTPAHSVATQGARACQLGHVTC